MTEQLLSPTVVAYENDQSFYTQGSANTGLAVVGPTEKGAAFIPTDITSYSQYTAIFGTDSKNNYTAQTVYNYLQAGSAVKVTRVLGNGGWSYSSSRKLAAIVMPSSPGSAGTQASASFTTASLQTALSLNAPVYLKAGTTAYFSGFSGASAFYSSETPDWRYYETSGSAIQTAQSFIDSVNRAASITGVSASFLAGSGSISLKSGTTGTIGNTYTVGTLLYIEGGVPVYYEPVTQFAGGSSAVSAGDAKIVSVLYPTQNINPGASLNGTTAAGTFDSFNMSLVGAFFDTTAVSASMNPQSDTYLVKVLGSDATTKQRSIFPYLMFENAISNSGVIGTSTPISSSLVFTTSNCTFTSSNASGYDHASTPWVLADSGIRLFKVHHKSDGTKTNRDVKVAISNIKKGATASDYSTFDIIVRAWNDTDRTPSIIEQFSNLSLNPDSANYIAAVIGDKYSYYDEAQGKVIETGDYNSSSNFIRIEVSTQVSSKSAHPQVYPNGHEALYETIAGFGSYKLPAATVISSNSGSFVYSGFDYSNTDNVNYLNPVPSEATVGDNVAFVKPATDNKFVLPFQGGTDGMNYTVIKKLGTEILADGTNLFGFDLSSDTAPGYTSYKRALDILSNVDEHSFDLLVLPGVLEEYHSAVTAYAQAVAEERTDCVYIRDLVSANASVTTAISTAAGLDSSYSATYYPWVKVRDLGSRKDILVPPSVVIPEVYAYNDRVAAEWYAPAGLSRGLVAAIDVKNRLKQSEKNALYVGKINPIVRFANTGVAVWGQKTLQIQDTALNRINVRRLLIGLRKYISNVAKNFVFENNTITTRNKLINELTPYMENVQTRQGLYAFRIDISENLNTNDVIDRNQLVGKIYVSPAKSIEFILLEFNITATGGITF